MPYWSPFTVAKLLETKAALSVVNRKASQNYAITKEISFWAGLGVCSGRRSGISGNRNWQLHATGVWQTVQGLLRLRSL